MTKELEERPKLGMMKEIAALELESCCAVLKGKRDSRMMIKLRGGTTAFQIEVESDKELRGRRERARNARVKKLKTSATGCYSAQPGTISGDPWWRKSASVMAFKGSLTKQVAFVLATACTNPTLFNYLSSMWYARFGA